MATIRHVGATEAKRIAPMGAVALFAGASGRSECRARAAVSADGAEVWLDGRLTLAWVPGRHRSFHVSETIACLVDGAVYETGESETSARALAVAYERRGEASFQTTRGEFWAVIWDRQRRHGVVVTDQMGAGAPYWTRQAGELVVASEIRELLATLTRRPGPDALAIAHWLRCTAAPGGATVFAGVRRLEPGHLLRFGDRLEEPRRYWSPAYRPLLRAPREDLVARLRDSLAVAVKRRASGDTRAGVLLSGGLDSTVVAGLASAAGVAPHAFSATFPEHPTIDESELIDLIAGRLGLRSTRIVVRGGSVLAGALDYIETWRTPPASPNLFFWTPLLDQAAEAGVTAVLDGEGGDELFGLSPYLLADRLRHGRLISMLRLADGWPPPFHDSSAARVRLRIRRFGIRGALPASAHTVMRRVRRERDYLPTWMAPSLGRAWLETEDTAYAWKQLPGPRWWAWLLAGVSRGPGPALVYEQARRRAALAGLHARHPLVDPDVIELVLTLPPELAFDRRHSRPLLRDSVAGLLPDEVRLRTAKSNFDALFHGALAGIDLPMIDRILSARDAELRGYADLDWLHRELIASGPPADPARRRGWAIAVWRTLTAECWLRSEADDAYLRRLRSQIPAEHDVEVRV